MLLAEGDIAVWVTGFVTIIVNALLTVAAMAITLRLAKRADTRQDTARDLEGVRKQENVDLRLQALEVNKTKTAEVMQELTALKVNQENMLHSFDEFTRRIESSVTQLSDLVRSPGTIQTIERLSVGQGNIEGRLAVVEQTLRRCKTCAEAAAGGWPQKDQSMTPHPQHQGE